MDLLTLPKISSVSGQTLNVEEMSGLESGMVERKLEEKLTGKMKFWGKIFGSTQDYLIVECMDLYGEFPEKSFYYCNPSNYYLRALPPLSKEYEETAKSLTARFTGDASFFAYNGEDPEEPEPDPEDENAAPVERFRELHRLSYVVRKIDHDCALVPGGAVIVDAAKKVVFSPYYAGLSYQTLSEHRAYFHLRKPENLQGAAILKKPGFVKPTEFLDCISKDTPTQMWNISLNSAGTTSVVRNLFWEGYTFYASVGSSEYGGAYFGLGVSNPDLAFMF